MCMHAKDDNNNQKAIKFVIMNLWTETPTVESTKQTRLFLKRVYCNKLWKIADNVLSPL